MIQGQTVMSKIAEKGPYKLTVKKLRKYDYETQERTYIRCYRCNGYIKPLQLYAQGKDKNFCLDCVEEI